MFGAVCWCGGDLLQEGHGSLSQPFKLNIAPSNNKTQRTKQHKWCFRSNIIVCNKITISLWISNLFLNHQQKCNQKQSITSLRMCKMSLINFCRTIMVIYSGHLYTVILYLNNLIRHLQCTCSPKWCSYFFLNMYKLLQ